MTALTRAIVNDDKPAFAAALAAVGADVNARDFFGATALMHAVDDDRPEFADALLAAGADVNARDNWDRTALTHAAAPEMDSPDQYGPVKTSRDGRIYEPVQINHHTPSNPRIIATLIKANADCGTKDKQGMTPLIHYARDGASTTNLAVLDALIRCGVSVNAKNNDGKTALMMAATQSPEVTAALLKAGAEVNAKDHFGETALMLAAHHGKGPEGIAALLKAGADIRVQNNFGQVAYDFARENWSLRGSKVLPLLNPPKK